MHSKGIILKKEPNYLFFWIIVLLIIFISLAFISFYKYNPYYVITGIYDKEVNNVHVLLENNKLFYVQDAEIRINKKVINKENVVVGEYVYLENKIYNDIIISSDNVYKDSLVNISFKLPKTTILEKIWKGMME